MIRDAKKAPAPKVNPYRARCFTFLVYKLFLSSVAGDSKIMVTFKPNDFPLFEASCHKLLLFFLLCRRPGSVVYQRTMFVLLFVKLLEES